MLTVNGGLSQQGQARRLLSDDIRANTHRMESAMARIAADGTVVLSKADLKLALDAEGPEVDKIIDLCRKATEQRKAEEKAFEELVADLGSRRAALKHLRG